MLPNRNPRKVNFSNMISFRLIYRFCYEDVDAKLKLSIFLLKKILLEVSISMNVFVVVGNTKYY